MSSELFTSAMEIAEKILEASSLYSKQIDDMAIVNTTNGFTWFFEPRWNPQTWSENRKEGYTLVESVKNILLSIKFVDFIDGYFTRGFSRLTKEEIASIIFVYLLEK